jgi:hypothetical protein
MRRALLPWGQGSNFAPTASGLLIRGEGCITTLSIRNAAAGAAVHVVLYDGESANHETLADIEVPANNALLQSWVLHALPYERGLYVVSGATTVVGSVTAWADHHCLKWLEAEHTTELLAGAEALAALEAR